MNIDFKTIEKKDNDYNKAMKLYKTAFLRNERESLFFLNHKAKNNDIFLKAIYSYNTQIGIIYYKVYNDILFILFFAFEKKYQSKGYGSKVLSKLKETYINKKIILEIEEVDEKFENYNERERRLKFYLKNDFKLSNIKVNISNDSYNIMFYKNDISYDEIKAFYNSYYGIFKLFSRLKIYKI